MNETQTMSRPAAKTEEAAREQLRSAIAKRDLMAGDLAQAVKAADAAQRRAWDAERKIADIGRKRAQSDRSFGDEGPLVAALLEGKSLAVGEAAADEKALRELEAEVEDDARSDLRGAADGARVDPEVRLRPTRRRGSPQSASHSPARAAAMLRPFNAAVIWRSDFAPVA